MTTNDIDRTGTEPTGSRWTGGRVAGLVFASLAGLVGLALLLGGLALIAVHGFARDDDGFYTTDRELLETNSYAITTDRIDLDTGVADDVPEDLLGTLRVNAESTGSEPIFLGIGPSADVRRYLAGVAHAEFVDVERGDPVLEEIPGRAPASTPGRETFWVAQSEGSGDQRVEWDAESGVWAVAVLNADASRGVAVDAEIGAKAGWLIWVGIGLTLLGLVVVVSAVLLIVHVGRRAARAGNV
jgi:hypothetical protein